MNRKALIVVTSNDQLGNSGKTGWFLSEVSHVYWPLKKAGFEIEFASPKGGEAPVEEKSMKLDDSENKKFVDEFNVKTGLQTKSVNEINSSDFDVIYFAGGHGTMWDFPDNEKIQEMISEIWDKGGIVSAVCHGPAALVNAKLSNGKYLLEGKRVNSFTNEEEVASGKDDVVPFLLESKIRERGGEYEKAGKMECKVIVDGNLITGQNPASASSLGEAIVRRFNELEQSSGEKEYRDDKSDYGSIGGF